MKKKGPDEEDDEDEDEFTAGMPDVYEVITGQVPEDKLDMVPGKPGETWDWDLAVRTMEDNF